MHPILAQVGPITILTHDAFSLLALSVGLAIYYRALQPRGREAGVHLLPTGDHRADRLGRGTGGLRARGRAHRHPLYARSITLGVHWSKCLLRRLSLIIGFWAVIAVPDAYWLFVLGGHLPNV